MVGTENVTAVLFERGDQPAHFRFHGVDIVPQNGVETAVQNKLVPIVFFDDIRIHPGLYLNGIQRVDADFDQFRDERTDVPAGV